MCLNCLHLPHFHIFIKCHHILNAINISNFNLLFWFFHNAHRFILYFQKSTMYAFVSCVIIFIMCHQILNCTNMHTCIIVSRNCLHSSLFSYVFIDQLRYFSMCLSYFWLFLIVIRCHHFLHVINILNFCAFS